MSKDTNPSDILKTKSIICDTDCVSTSDKNDGLMLCKYLNSQKLENWFHFVDKKNLTLDHLDSGANNKTGCNAMKDLIGGCWNGTIFSDNVRRIECNTTNLVSGNSTDNLMSNCIKTFKNGTKNALESCYGDNTFKSIFFAGPPDDTVKWLVFSGVILLFILILTCCICCCYHCCCKKKRREEIANTVSYQAQ